MRARLISSAVFTLAVLPTLLVNTALQAQWNRSHTTKDLEAFVLATFKGRPTVSIRRVLDAARAKGWIKNQTHLHTIKLQFRELSRRLGYSAKFLDLRKATTAKPKLHELQQALVEKEYNDSAGYANDLGPMTPVAKSIGGTLAANEVDVFSIQMLVDGVLTVTSTGTGGAPEIQVNSEHGDEIWGMAWQKTMPMNLPLPKGRYSINLWSSVAATYSLKVSASLKALPSLKPGTAANVSLGTSLHAHRVVLPADGRLTVTLASTLGADTYLWLLNSDWRYMFDVDNAGIVGVDAGLNALLPKGTYYIYTTSDKGTTTKFTPSFKKATIPTLGTSGINGSIPSGEEDFDLYKLALTKPQMLTLKIAAQGTSAITDSYLMVYDAAMAAALESDEESSNSSLSAISATLPAGTYYAASTGYYDFGGYTISMATGAAATTTARAGTNPTTMPAAATARTLTFSLLNESRIEFDTVEGTLLDAEMFVLDAKTGLSLGFEDSNFGGASCRYGGILPAGDYYVIIKDWDGGLGTFDVRIIPPLQRWGTTDTVMNRGHGGNPLYLVVNVKQAAVPTNPIPVIATGLLYVDPTLMQIFPLVMPSNGILDYKAGFKTGSGLFVQTVEFDNPTGGRFSNLLK